MRESAPGITLKTVTIATVEIEHALESGDIDLAIGYFPGLKGSAMYQQRLFGHTFACAVRSRHPLVGPKMTRRQFEDALHVVVEGSTNEVFEEALVANDVKRRVVLSLPHYLAIPVVVRDSDLFVTVPYAIAAIFAGVRRIADDATASPSGDAGAAAVLARSVPPRPVQPVVARRSSRTSS